MPELPEVEVVCRELHEKTVGKTVVAFDVYFPKCVHNVTPGELADRLVNRCIRRWRRRGKYVIMDADDGSCLSVHLRMTGQLLLNTKGETQVGPYTRSMMTLDDAYTIRFDDQRTFGRMNWYADAASLDEALRLGPDPLDASFTVDDFVTLMSGRQRSIKPLLLDQTIIAGIGNIYADEILFRSGIAPTRSVRELTTDEIALLRRMMREVLEEGIACGGTSFRDYVHSDGSQGTFQHYLQVYGREGLPCKHCRDPIVRKKIVGRSSFYCPRCQR